MQSMGLNLKRMNLAAKERKELKNEKYSDLSL